MMLRLKSVLALLLVAPSKVSGSLNKDEEVDPKSRNLRPVSGSFVPNKETAGPGNKMERYHRWLEDLDPTIDTFAQVHENPFMCDDGLCDVVLDPVTNLQFKSIGIDQLDLKNPFCLAFSDEGVTEGFAPCPGHFDNIVVNTSTFSGDSSINPLRGDSFLYLQDLPGGSLACGTGSEYTGDWTNVINARCFSLCFDVNVFFDGCASWVPNCKSNGKGGYFIPIYPTLILQGGAPNHYRAAFRANSYVTDPKGDNPGWHRICAPLASLDLEGNMPENGDGKWYMAAPNYILSGLPPVTSSTSPNSAWDDLLADVVAIQLPVDYTSNPAERIGYDHICLEEGECIDSCNPKPLCYWKHEWQCEHAKNEAWYSTFARLVAYADTFDIRNLCICDVLKDCCPDLCKIAEQEFLALLLNIASGTLALDCAVKECGDCASTVKDVAKKVDALLALSARSNYDCSLALRLLTGINEDEILCDSPGDCPQTEKCKLNLGRCVPKDLCDETQDGVSCDPYLCQGLDCTCMVKDPPATASPVTSRPTAPPSTDKPTGSPDLPATPSPVTSRPTRSPSTDKPTGSPDLPATPSPVTSRPTRSPSTDKPTGCDTTEKCKYFGTGGTCINNCVPVPGLVECNDVLCPDGRDCSCKHCLQKDTGCIKRGGRCMLQKDCLEQNLECDYELCGDRETDCACLLPTPPPKCPLTDVCLSLHGACIKNCVETDSLACGEECRVDDSSGAVNDECSCLKCRQNNILENPCREKGGFCTVFCIAGPGEVCDQSLCGGRDADGTQICSCKYSLRL